MDPSMLSQLLAEAVLMQSPSSDSSGPSSRAASSQSPASNNSKQGRNRESREKAVLELGGPLSYLPASTLKVANPVVPLKFEQPPGKWNAHQVICQEVTAMSDFEEEYVCPSVATAHVKALQAYSAYTSQEAVRMATEALSITPLCPEAYNVLALAAADSYEEALNYYRMAVEAGPKVLQPGLFEERMKSHEMWTAPPFRPYYRALYGVANTLRKMGRFGESLEAYERVLDADPNWYSWSSYVNVMALYPYVLLGAKGPKAVVDYMRTYKDTESHLLYMSSSVYWTSAYCLADLLLTGARGTSKRAGGAKVTRDDNWAADGLVDLQPMDPGMTTNCYEGMKRRPFFCFCYTFPLAVDTVLGDKALPPGLTPLTGNSNHIDAAASFVYTTGSQWRSNPTVLERLRRYRNTFELRSYILDLRQKVEIDLQRLRHYMTAPGGFHKGALERDTGGNNRSVKNLMYNLCDRPDGQEFGKQELKVLKWLIDAEVPTVHTHNNRPLDQALHMACYQGYGPDAVKLLLSGSDQKPFILNHMGQSPLSMTANQGNWREMLAFFEVLPHLKTTNAADVDYSEDHAYLDLFKMVTIPEALILELFASSCLPCLHGGDCCMRCTNGIPHSPHADFYKYAAVLVADSNLQKLHPCVLHEMEDVVYNTGGPSTVWGKLSKVIMAAIADNKKSALRNQPQVGPPAGSSTTAGKAGKASAAADSKGSSSHSKVAATSPPAADERQCWSCGQKPKADGTLQKCSGCRKALYCSRACQESAWKSHKSDCKQWKSERSQKKLLKAEEKACSK